MDEINTQSSKSIKTSNTATYTYPRLNENLLTLKRKSSIEADAYSEKIDQIDCSLPKLEVGRLKTSVPYKIVKENLELNKKDNDDFKLTSPESTNNTNTNKIYYCAAAVVFVAGVAYFCLSENEKTTQDSGTTKTINTTSTNKIDEKANDITKEIFSNMKDCKNKSIGSTKGIKITGSENVSMAMGLFALAGVALTGATFMFIRRRK